MKQENDATYKCREKRMLRAGAVLLAAVLMCSVLMVGAVGAEGTAVAKVSNTDGTSAIEYTNIRDAIAAWGNNKLLTLLADVTLSDVIELKSTEHHILNLGTYTMTAASDKNAIEITPCFQSSHNDPPCITVNADSNTPGGITATGKTCIYYKQTGPNFFKYGDTIDRAKIIINNGVFNGDYAIQVMHGNTNDGLRLEINDGIFNAKVSLTKGKMIISDGTFNEQVSCTGGSTAYRQISGGKFKSFGFMTADAYNKFWIGTAVNNYNREVYIDDEGYFVVTSSPDMSNIKASISYQYVYSFLIYSNASNNGVYYTDAETALERIRSQKVKVGTFADIYQEDFMYSVAENAEKPFKFSSYSVGDFSLSYPQSSSVTFNVVPNGDNYHVVKSSSLTADSSRMEVIYSQHKFDNSLTYNDTHHYYACNTDADCPVKKDVTPHSFTQLGYNETHHWNECTCGAKDIGSDAEHIWENDCDSTCNLCDITRTPLHTIVDDWAKNENDHWYQCACGQERVNEAPHTLKQELSWNETHHWHNCTEDCGAELNKEEHALVWNSTSSGHWQECTTCDYRTDIAAHTPVDDGDCTTAVLCSVTGCTQIVTPAQASHTFSSSSDTTCNNADCSHTRTVNNGGGGGGSYHPPEYTVTFFTDEDDDVPFTVTGDVSKGTVIEEPEAPVREGEEFVGWALDPEGTELWDFSKPISKDMILYAIYKPADAPTEPDENPDDVIPPLNPSENPANPTEDDKCSFPWWILLILLAAVLVVGGGIWAWKKKRK